MKSFNEFVGLYSQSKTLRFELRPIGRTLENIVKSDILENDEHRATSYGKVKKIIDEYHKAFMDSALRNFKLKVVNEGKEDSLEEYFYWYNIKDKGDAGNKKFATIQKSLREQIAKRLKGDEKFKRIFAKELIKEDLIEFVGEDIEKKSLVEEFKDFTTYFTGFHQNRKNMYSSEEESTAIAYRLIHDNLPKFVDNMLNFEKARDKISDGINKLYKDLEGYLNVEELPEMFCMEYYNMVLTQTQIDVYNAVVGGRTLNDGTKIQGLNEYINLYNQQHQNETRLPKLKPLFKQILSDRNAISWLPENFSSDEDVLHAIKDFYKSLSVHVLGDDEGQLKSLLTGLASGKYQLGGVFVSNDQLLTTISQKKYGDWGKISNAIKKDIEQAHPQNLKKETYEKWQETIAKLIKANKSFSIQYINDCIKSAAGEAAGEAEGIDKYFSALGADWQEEGNLFDQISQAYENVRNLLENPYPKENNLAQDKKNVEKIKLLLDTIKDLQHFIKPLAGCGAEPDKDGAFYGEYATLWDELDKITPLYNMTRNYMTRKPYSIEKVKLNFENSTLMAGWDLNKERDNTAVILKKDGLYYLAIMDKRYKKVFVDYPPTSENGSYEKMVYKLLPDAYRMLPKVFILSKSGIEEFAPSDDLLDKYKKGTHKKGDNFKVNDARSLIDFFKSSINKHEDWKNFDFHFSDTSTYDDMSGFYREVDQQGYKLTFRPVSVDYINSLVDEGKLYLFQIYNKDFSPYSKGTPNMHTLYWKMLFDERNLKDVVYKLNGQAEIFFRKSSIKCDHPTHPANHPVKNKNVNNAKKESTFSYDLIKDRRYTVDKFQFHVPITMNFKSVGTDNINLQVKEYLREASDVNVIGIDRGERHLLYVVVSDKNGNIKEQFSLNTISNEYNGNRYDTDYHNLLDKKESERNEARKSWKNIENIKELKEGYLSQAVHKIAELMVKYNAIVVLEDLNSGFMRGRQKVEKQVYQKFERMLIEKLNYLVNKKKPAEEPGGLLKAFQLTSKFESFNKLGKQSGFLFYVPAWNTSKIDPVTGFVNLLDTRYESIDKARKFLEKFDSIRYNAEREWFEFSLDYNNFTQKAEGTKTQWMLCTHGKRIETFRNAEKNSSWDNREVSLTAEFGALLKASQIKFKGGDDLKGVICSQAKKEFFERLLHLLKLTLQMRNSVTGTDTDYLVSPVADADGNFYDSRTCGESLPANADANGAYNIARKGLWVIRKIREAEDLNKVKLAITNKEWLRFVQEKEYLNG